MSSPRRDYMQIAADCLQEQLNMRIIEIFSNLKF